MLAFKRIAGSESDFVPSPLCAHGADPFNARIGIAPGGNINYDTGHAIFEATHGTAPKYANQDKVNPGSVILSGEMMLRYLGWTEAADLIIQGVDGAISAREVTYDFHRLMETEGQKVKLLKCSEFGQAVVRYMR